jgi:uncharacterized cupredoxin-like copper-binding protein
MRSRSILISILALGCVLCATTSAFATPPLLTKARSLAKKAGHFARQAYDVAKMLPKAVPVALAPKRAWVKKDGTTVLEGYALTRRGVVLKNRLTTAPDGTTTEVQRSSIKMPNGEKIDQIEVIERKPGTRPKWVVSASRNRSTDTSEKKVELHEDPESPRGNSKVKAHLKAVLGSPVAHVAMTTTATYLLLDVGLHALGFHPSPGQVIAMTIGAKSLTFSGVLAHAISEVTLHTYEPWAEKEAVKWLRKVDVKLGEQGKKNKSPLERQAMAAVFDTKLLEKQRIGHGNKFVLSPQINKSRLDLAATSLGLEMRRPAKKTQLDSLPGKRAKPASCLRRTAKASRLVATCLTRSETWLREPPEDRLTCAA